MTTMPRKKTKETKPNRTFVRHRRCGLARRPWAFALPGVVGTAGFGAEIPPVAPAGRTVRRELARHPRRHLGFLGGYT
jgi:hypothetical protein